MDTRALLEDIASKSSQIDRPLNILKVCSARNATYGAVVSMASLADELRRNGHNVIYATFRGRGLGEVVRAQGYPVREVKVRAKVDLLAALSLAKVIRRDQIDVVHTHLSTSSVLGGLAARLAGVPSVGSVHGLSGKLSFQTCHHLIAVSEEVMRHLVHQGVPESKISIVHNGISVGPTPDEASRQAVREELGISPRAHVLGTVARLTPLKGVEQALHAVARLAGDYPDVIYLLFGDGEARADYEALAERLGISANVRFMGYRSDVRDLLPALDVFLFPSMREAMGIAIVEAMAAGVPVVANRIGGIPEVVSEGTGFLVSPGDPVSMAEEADKLLRDSQLRLQMSANALQRVRAEFSVQRMGQKTVAVYQALLLRRRARNNRPSGA